MTELEFEQIIKPLSLLSKDKKEFLKKALIGNFKKWEGEKELTTKNK